MKSFLRSLLFSWLASRLTGWGQQSMQQKSLLLYLRALQITRRSLLAAICIFFFLQLMVLGFFGAIATALWISPIELNTKLWILFGIFATLFAVPAIGLLIAFSEKVWFVQTGARDLWLKNTSDAE